MKEYTPQNPVFSDKFNLVERADSVNAQIHNTSVRQAMDNTVALKNQIDSYMGSTEGGKPQFVDGIKSDNVVGAVNEVFQLGGEKKAQLVENLTAMGVQASTSDTWDELLEKILDMTDTSGDTVTAPVLLTGYTAHDASGEQISGDMPEMAAVTVEAVSTTQDSEYTYLGLPEGHYSDDSKVRTKNSNLSKVYYIKGQSMTDGVGEYTFIAPIAGSLCVLAIASTLGLYVKKNGTTLASGSAGSNQITDRLVATPIAKGDVIKIYAQSGYVGFLTPDVIAIDWSFATNIP